MTVQEDAKWYRVFLDGVKVMSFEQCAAAIRTLKLLEAELRRLTAGLKEQA